MIQYSTRLVHIHTSKTGRGNGGKDLGAKRHRKVQFFSLFLKTVMLSGNNSAVVIRIMVDK
tara:strand:- start:408 stop:590 length:183 start_codon:yes stop_codon:yes gene_type:complete